ncbi:MAG: acylphosphatase [Deltaproteobacteria bacterium]
MNRSCEAHVVVTGKVQGVFFRASTREVAAACGVRGYVRNLPDRSVEAVLQGEREAVEKVIEFMGEGPPGALVTGIRVDWREPTADFPGFDVRR